MGLKGKAGAEGEDDNLTTQRPDWKAEKKQGKDKSKNGDAHQRKRPFDDGHG